MQSERKVKPCPKCGGTNYIVCGRIVNGYAVACIAGHEPFEACAPASIGNSRAEALKAWNRFKRAKP